MNTRTLNYLRRALLVRRFHQHATLEVDTVGKHSLGVALLTHLMDPNARKCVILAAMVHDLGEYAVGDIPAPTKRMMSPEAKNHLADLEDEVLRMHGLNFQLTDDEWQLIKVADCLDGLCFVAEERTRGNMGLHEVGMKYCEYLLQVVNRLDGALDWHEAAKNISNMVIQYWKDTQ